jgi:hypothetical protein
MIPKKNTTALNDAASTWAISPAFDIESKSSEMECTFYFR